MHHPVFAELHDLEELVRSARRIAVVGLSSTPTRPSHGVARQLLRLGYDVVPVNPNEISVLGVDAVTSLDEVEPPIDIVDVFRRAEHAPELARQAVAVGARTVWLQSGITSPEARRIAVEHGLGYVEDACLGVVASRLGGPGA